MTETGAVDLNRHVYGNADAPTTIVEYGDFECPYCKAAAPVVRQLVDESDGTIRLVWRHFPLFNVHPYALTAALAAEASGILFWEMHDQLFANQAHLTDQDLAGYAAEIGVGEVTGPAAQAYKPAVAADYQSGSDEGIRGTPTLFINGLLYTGRMKLSALEQSLIS